MKTRSTGAIALAACVIAPAIVAQRPHVNPPANATVEGGSRISFPFGQGNGDMRYQQVCALSTQSTAVGQIDRIAFRRDNDTIVNSANYNAWTVDMTVSVSTSPRTPLTMSLDFATNVGTDVMQVHTGPLNWPAENKVPPGPTGFVYTVPFSAPFLYLPTKGDICVDIGRQPNNPNTNPLFFMDAAATGGGSSSRLLGAGCPAGSNKVVVYDNWGPGSTARILEYTSTSNIPSVLSLSSTSPIWGGLLLPVDLAPVGAPGCNIYGDNQILVPGMLGATGRWDFTFEIPNNPMFGGLQVRTQFINFLDTNAGNAVNLSVSDGNEVTLATPTPGVPPHSEAHASGVNSTRGALLQQGYGMVIEFNFR